MVRSASASPSPLGSFHKKPSQIKMPLLPHREQGQKIHLCGTTLFAGKSGHSVTVPTHRLPLTQAIRQQILRLSPFPSALGGPFAAPLFAPLSAAGTLCGCAAQFYFRFHGLLMVTLFNYRFVCLSRTFFRQLWKRLSLSGDCDKIKSNSSFSLCFDSECRGGHCPPAQHHVTDSPKADANP